MPEVIAQEEIQKLEKDYTNEIEASLKESKQKCKIIRQMLKIKLT